MGSALADEGVHLPGAKGGGRSLTLSNDGADGASNSGSLISWLILMGRSAAWRGNQPIYYRKLELNAEMSGERGAEVGTRRREKGERGV